MMSPRLLSTFRLPCLLLGAASLSAHAVEEPIQFSRQIRPILSENCFFCHGPDEKKREAGLRLDIESAAKGDNQGTIAVVPGSPEKSALIQRIESTDPDEVMPPPKLHKTISKEQVELLKAWIRQGAPWGNHWAYEPVKKPQPPTPAKTTAIHNPIDAFLLHRLEKEGLDYSPQAPPEALLRRLALDLTGLPPTLKEIDEWLPLINTDYTAVVDHFLSQPAYGEHWATQWLDLARYADSSGYPSDQPREIWAWRDWVVNAFNRNLPFDQFTIEQIAGDLLPDPTADQIIATAFHRNTMTQNEGGTSDEEFRNAAVIDRVNTTMAVWMGTTMACAQCHTHKYDPLTIKEYYQFYDFLNQTADADKKDESPLHSFFTADSLEQKRTLQEQIDSLESQLAHPPASWLAGMQAWEQALPREFDWGSPKNTVNDDTISLPLEGKQLTAVRIQMAPGAGAFSLNSVKAEIVPPGGAAPPQARFVRIEIPGKKRFLQLAEVEVFSGGKNIAMEGKAAQSSRYAEAAPARAIDGNTNGDYAKGSVAHTMEEDSPWWQLDLQKSAAIDSIRIWNRTDGKVGSRLNGYRVLLLDEKKKTVWSVENQPAPEADATHATGGPRTIAFALAIDDASPSPLPADALSPANEKAKPLWSVPARSTQPRSLTLLSQSPVDLAAGSALRVTLKGAAPSELSRMTISTSSDPRAAQIAALPAPVLTALRTSVAERTDPQNHLLQEHYIRHVSKEAAPSRKQLEEARKKLAAIQPVTVPVMVELPAAERRKSHVQNRGEWQNLGEEVRAATPAVFHPLPKGAPRDRLTLARWLVSRDNPLTARVTVNRYWESLFGAGIVRTSEEFGSQGELPFHPELLDWLAAEFMDSGWDIKHLLKLLVTSRAYRQDSGVTPELAERDPENRLLARGPRFRPNGELLRDQALAVSGLLSKKMGGPPVRPMAPNLGLNAAFGRSIDWTVSEGEDRHRRSLYTEMRRNAPYASFTTFDAGNREVCMIRRNRTNTPLQAFVTLNDPVFIETHQAMARRLLAAKSGSDAERLHLLYKLTLCRKPEAKEQQALLAALEKARGHFGGDQAAAIAMASDPLGPLPDGVNAVEAAAWTTVANIVMNLDEFLMRR